MLFVTCASQLVEDLGQRRIHSGLWVPEFGSNIMQMWRHGLPRQMKGMIFQTRSSIYNGLWAFSTLDLDSEIR